MENFDHESFDAQLDGFSEKVDSIREVAAVLRDHHEPLALVAITELHELQVATGALAKSMGLDAIRSGEMSRIKLAGILGVHQVTVARWLAEETMDQS